MASSMTHSATASMASASTVPSEFSVYDNAFYKILGSAPTLDMIHENQSYPFAHEASVYIPSSETLFMSSNIFTDPITGEKTIKITKARVSENPVTAEIINTTVPMPNGGVNHGAGILWTGQGTMNSTGGLFQMSVESPYKAELVVGGFYGRQFNSPNDVVVSSDGSYWFTDPVYAWRQGLRPKPTLPNQVYRYDPVSKNVRVIADGFGRPNGITFSPDEETVYITDTAENNGDGSTDKMLAATIYAFDVVKVSEEPFLTNRRVFAMPGDGFPDGVKVDMDGNVYAGCGDGVNVWSAGGVLLGKVLIKDGTSNFSFGKNGTMFIMNENKLWKAQLNKKVHGNLF
ncbi:hypothetical protein N7476_000329 [Penicillium atrosanguineum]|uniref:SMP-30/Gluconolactonase/LRE-like region domain-containing protein n=1 Tax=Penicillium atrosanguineum TaxID=1132637 RepID=A0A9W9UBN4_9EURO|nr:hypothetical protein N7476_000329 [Penicillium atrosanguineum]